MVANERGILKVLLIILPVRVVEQQVTNHSTTDHQTDCTNKNCCHTLLGFCFEIDVYQLFTVVVIAVNKRF